MLVTSFRPQNYKIDFTKITTLPAIYTSNRSGTASTYLGSNGSLMTASADAPRFEYNPQTLLSRGLLLEGTRSNQIRNSIASGVASGTPGTAPTNWGGIYSTSFVAGTSHQITGTGTIDGVPGFYVRFYGTPTTNGIVAIQPESNSQITASTGQTWVLSSYVKLTAGSLTNAVFKLMVRELTSAGSSVQFDYGPDQTAELSATSTANIRNCRFSYFVTLSGGATVGRAWPHITFGVTNGNPIDFTIFIGLPQMEAGTHASSVIRTSSGAISRPADNIYISNLSDIGFNSSEGTFIVEVEINNAAAVNNNGKRIVQFDDGSDNNYISPTISNGNTQNFIGSISNNSTVTSTSNGPIITAGSIVKMGLAYKSGSNLAVLNGSVISGSSFQQLSSIPTINTLRLGNSFALNRGLNGWLRRFEYLPYRESDNYIQNRTS